jgi:hypothetical protein
VLLLAGVGALVFSVPIGLCSGAVIGIVILSYRQNIAAYPQGACDYIVAKDNLGVFPGLTAGAASSPYAGAEKWPPHSPSPRTSVLLTPF